MRKDLFGELISNWLVTPLAALGLLLACVAWLSVALNIPDPNVTQCMQRRARAGVRHFEAPGRLEERLLFWTVREEEWVVTAPYGRVFVEKLRPWVDGFAGHYDRRVVGDALQFSQGLTKLSESACFCLPAPSPIGI